MQGASDQQHQGADGPGENAYEFEHRKSVVLVIGVNGVGKTTSVGKLAGQRRTRAQGNPGRGGYLPGGCH